MKKYIRILFETFFWLICFTDLAHAGFVAAAFSAIAGLINAGGIIGAIVKIGLSLALKVGLSLLQKALTPKRDQRQPGIKGSLQVGGANPLSFLIGYIATAGQLEYVNTWGKIRDTPNAYITMVISVSDIPITSLLSTIWVSGERCEIDFTAMDRNLGYPIKQFKSSSGSNYGWVRFHNGDQTEADDFLLEKFSTDPSRPWTADMVGRGIAYAIVTLRFDRDFFKGVPSIRFECQGIKQYIVAKDSTNGGSGVHRWDNEATREYAEDNATAIYNIVRGIYFNGEWVYGGQNLSAQLLPNSTWIAGYNECNLDIPLKDGGTEKQFRCGYEVIVNQEPLSVVERFLEGANGYMPDLGGFYKLHIGPPSPSVYSFTDADIVATEELQLDPFPGLQQTYNAATARYPEPMEAWELKDAPPYFVEAYRTQDEGRRLIADLNFDTTFSNTQVQRLMKSVVEANRRFRRHIVCLPPETAVLEPGIDTVDWTSVREGYNSKDFLVMATTSKPGMAQFIQILEIDNNDFNWTPSTDQQNYATSYVGSVIPDAQEMGGWFFVPAIDYDGSNVARRPTIAVSFPGDSDDVAQVHIQIRHKQNLSMAFEGSIAYGDVGEENSLKTVKLPGGPFLPNEEYEGRGTFVPYSGREIEWTDWFYIKTDDVRLGSSDLSPIEIKQIAQGFYDAIQDAYKAKVELTERIEILSAAIMNTASRSVKQDSVVVTNQRANAKSFSILAAQIVETENGLEVLADAITGVQTQINDLDGTVAGQSSAINALQATSTQHGDDIEALASDITTVEATVGDVSGQGLYRLVAQAGSGEVITRLVVQVRATTGSAWVEAGTIWEAGISGGVPFSRIVMQADQFLVTDGSTEHAPLAFIGGKLTLDVASIGIVEAGLIQGAEQSMIIDIDNEFISIKVPSA